MRTSADGDFAFTTVRPAPYSVPDDGPVGMLLRATGRHAWRPDVYDNVNHAFHNDTSDARYDQTAAELAWARTIAFFKEHLGA